MSFKTQTPEWRQFEQQVARIERAMAPLGAVVLCPDNLPDKDTGISREIDATIKYQIGTAPVLIMIECRCRNDAQDVTWIEQLAQKRASVGASIALAVSASGFSAPAIQKAKTLGIVIRTLSDSSIEKFIAWLRFQEVDCLSVESELIGLNIDLYDRPDGAKLAPEVIDSLNKDNALARIFVRKLDQKAFHAIDIFYELEKHGVATVPPSLPEDGLCRVFTFRVPMARECFTVMTTLGICEIKEIRFRLKASKTRNRVPVSKLTEYTDDRKSLVQSAHWEVTDELGVALHRDLETGATKIDFGSYESEYKFAVTSCIPGQVTMMSRPLVRQVKTESQKRP